MPFRKRAGALPYVIVRTRRRSEARLQPARGCGLQLTTAHPEMAGGPYGNRLVGATYYWFQRELVTTFGKPVEVREPSHPGRDVAGWE